MGLRRPRPLRDAILVYNERVKLFSTFTNALALGLIGFAILRPLTGAAPGMAASALWWGLAGLVLHGVSHYILGYLKKEERNP